MKQAILNISDLPKFSQIKIEDIEPAIDQLINENKRKLQQLLKDRETISWQALSEQLQQMDNTLSRVWSPVSHMNSVVNSDELRKAHDNCIPKLSAYSTEYAQNSDLFEAYNRIKNSDEFNQLDQPSKKAIENTLLQFKLNGVALDDEKKQQFKKIKQQLF